MDDRAGANLVALKEKVVRGRRGGLDIERLTEIIERMLIVQIPLLSIGCLYCGYVS